MNNLYATSVEIPHEKYHRHNFILHCGLNYVCEAYDKEEFMWFMNFAGLKMTDTGEHLHFPYHHGETHVYSVDGAIENKYFRHMEEIPAGAKKFKGLSNGSFVDCYLLNKNNIVTIYRPNPNNPEIYKPLSTEAHVAYARQHCLV